MGVRGLSGYLSRFPENFIPYQLHNTLVVFDAENFINSCYRNSSLPFLYGGEYMDFTVCVRIFLKQLNKCRITPVFLFDGCHGKEGTKLNTLVRRNVGRIEDLRSFITNSGCQDVDGLMNSPDILPKLTNNVFVEILCQSGIAYVACNREADVHIAELAVHLDCPLVSNDSDFYIFRPPPAWRAHRSYRVIPLSSLASQCQRAATKCSDCRGLASACYTLPCSIFNPEGPSLGGLEPSLLPLFAVLVGNDFVDSLRLPPCIEADMRRLSQSGGQLSYTARRIDALLRWLSSFKASPDTVVTGIVGVPLKEVLSLYAHSELSAVANRILLALLDYELHPNEICQQMCTFIDVCSNKICPMENPTATTDSPDIGVSMISHDITSVSTCVRSITEILKQNSSTRGNDLVIQDFSYRWPHQLVSSLRKCHLSTSLLDPLYVHNGAVLRLLFEDIDQVSESIYMITSRLRFAQYGLLIGLEKRLGYLEKLCGLEQSCAVEHRRHGVHMSKFSIPVSPINLSTSSKCTGRSLLIDFFEQYLHVPLPGHGAFHRSSVDSPELNGLAVAFAFWFKHSQTARLDSGDLLRPNSSPVGLAFIGIALMTDCHLSEVVKPGTAASDLGLLARASADLCEVYIQCASQAKQACLRSGIRMAVVHQINELQVVLLDLRHLTGLLDTLISSYCPSPSPATPSDQASAGLLAYQPLWTVFPSGRLLYWLSEQLSSRSPATRLTALLTDWLPALAGHLSGAGCLQTVRDRIHRLLEMVDNLLGV